MFVALDLAHKTREALVAWQRELLALSPDDLRVLPRDSLHVTLVFLGYRYLREVDQIAAAMKQAVEGPVGLAFEHRPVPRPPRRPRLYAAPAQQRAALMDLRAGVAIGLARIELKKTAKFEDEKRPFWPHVTLCRVKSSAHAHRPIEHLPGAAPELAVPVLAPSMTLYSSDLRPSGAVYTALAIVELPSDTG